VRLPRNVPTDNVTKQLQSAGAFNQKDRNAVPDGIGKTRFFTDQLIGFMVVDQRSTRFWADQNTYHFWVDWDGRSLCVGHRLYCVGCV